MHSQASFQVKGQDRADFDVPLSGLRGICGLSKDGVRSYLAPQRSQRFFGLAAAEDEATAPSAEILVQFPESGQKEGKRLLIPVWSGQQGLVKYVHRHDAIGSRQSGSQSLIVAQAQVATHPPQCSLHINTLLIPLPIQAWWPKSLVKRTLR
jgi:hypothetical protein